MTNDSTNLFTCLQCGNTFYMTDTEMEWFAARGMHIPKRCPVCREQNRVAGRTTRHIIAPEIQAALNTLTPVVEPAPVPKPEPKPEPKLTPAIFYGRVVINTAKVHGNAKYHIFDAEGKSLCNDYDTTEDILLANARIDSPDIGMVCKHCRAKLNKN